MSDGPQREEGSGPSLSPKGVLLPQSQAGVALARDLIGSASQHLLSLPRSSWRLATLLVTWSIHDPVVKQDPTLALKGSVDPGPHVPILGTGSTWRM